MAKVTPKGWRSVERRTESGAVFLQQTARPPRPAVSVSEAGARELADRYWHEIETVTRRLVQAREREEGIELRLLGRWTLLAFGSPETLVDSFEARSQFPILGGALARLPGGSITFTQTNSPIELRTTVDGFMPWLATGTRAWGWVGAVSWEVERRLHLAISRRYLARLVEQAAR